ncbi:MAG: helix-turn-helix domain-containing protein [Carboxylicivirga sp.]|jgi:transcriptional regulator with XRE-family HTH domain|nr:helix-turn-helix domain-containing protein [Carboxylicivirga sp.]
MDLGNAIKRIRKEKGLTQIFLAEACGITQTYLSQIEGNVKEPNISTVKKIANSLEIPLPVLFFLAIDKEDITPEKQEAFKMIELSVKSLISKFFLPNDNQHD